MTNEPEQRIEPPDDPPTYKADCGHQVYYTDDYDLQKGIYGGVYLWEGKHICTECMKEKIDEESLKVRASKWGAEFLTIAEWKNQ